MVVEKVSVLCLGEVFGRSNLLQSAAFLKMDKELMVIKLSGRHDGDLVLIKVLNIEEYKTLLPKPLIEFDRVPSSGCRKCCLCLTILRPVIHDLLCVSEASRDRDIHVGISALQDLVGDKRKRSLVWEEREHRITELIKEVTEILATRVANDCLDGVNVVAQDVPSILEEMRDSFSRSVVD